MENKNIAYKEACLLTQLMRWTLPVLFLTMLHWLTVNDVSTTFVYFEKVVSIDI